MRGEEETNKVSINRWDRGSPGKGSLTGPRQTTKKHSKRIPATSYAQFSPSLTGAAARVLRIFFPGILRL